MLKRNVLLMVVLCGLSGVLSAGVALNQDFDGLTEGSLSAGAQGSAATVGGVWQAAGTAVDPSIVALDPCEPDALSVRLTCGEAMCFGYSTAAPVAEGVPFIVSFSVYTVPWSVTDVGSFEVLIDDINHLGPSSVIHLKTFTVGNIHAYDGIWGDYRPLDGVNLFTSQATWVKIKIHVTTWDDGTGWGRYDVWTDSGNGFFLGARDIAIDPSKLHDGVNSILLLPRIPTTKVAGYFDDIYITTEPLDCADVKLLGSAPEADVTGDCVVDEMDLSSWAPSWLESVDYVPVTWDYQWDCDELPVDALGGTLFAVWQWSEEGDPGEQWVSDGMWHVRSTGGLTFATKPDIYDPCVPVMVEFSASVEKILGDKPFGTALVFWQKDYGYMRAATVEPGGWVDQPEDPNAFENYRCVTFVDDAGNIDGSRFYYQDESDMWIEAFDGFMDLSNPTGATPSSTVSEQKCNFC